MDSRFRGNDKPHLLTLTAYVLIEITPFRIEFFDQLNLPDSIPFLDLLFPRYGSHYISMYFIPHKLFDRISLREPIRQTLLVLPNTLCQV